MNHVDYTVLAQTHPHIVNRLKSIWGSTECRDYLNSLISDSRGGTRSGFSPSVARVIIALMEDHDFEFPQFNNTTAISPQRFKIETRANLKTPVSTDDDWRVISTLLKISATIIVIILLFKYLH